MISKDLLSMARDVVVIVGIALFGLGYFYRDGYLTALGVSPHATSSDVNETVIFAITVLELQWWFFAVFGVVVAGVLYALGSWSRKAKIDVRDKERLNIGFASVAALCLLLFGATVAGAAGRRVAHDVLKGTDVHFSTMAFDDHLPAEYRKALQRDFGDSESGLVIVAENADSYFVVQTQADLPDDRWLSAFRLPKTYVRGVRTFQEP